MTGTNGTDSDGEARHTSVEGGGVPGRSSDSPAPVQRAPDAAAEPRPEPRPEAEPRPAGELQPEPHPEPASHAPGQAPLSRDPVYWLLAALGAFTVGSAVWWLVTRDDTSAFARVTGGPSFVAGMVLLWLGYRLRTAVNLIARTRLAWAFVAAGTVLYGLGSIVHTAAYVVSGPAYLQPLGSALQLAAYPTVAVALALVPQPSRTRTDLILFWLDISIVAWSGAMLFWHFIFFPVAHDAGADLVATVGAAVFPVLDLSLLFVIAAILIRGPGAGYQTMLSVAAAGGALVFLGDVLGGIRTLQGTYVLGGAVGILYSAGWLGLASTAYMEGRLGSRIVPSAALTDYSRSFVWLPYVAVAIAFVAPAIHDWNNNDLLRQHVPATGLLIALVVARLGVTAAQNASMAAAERERLAAAVEQASEGILTADRSGNVTYANPAFTRITGLAADEIIGDNMASMGEPLDPAVADEIRMTLIGGNSWQGRMSHKRKDGTTVELDLALSPMRDSSSAVVGYVEIVRDITRERALEAQLAQSQRMEAVGRLAGGIAHDFNNILTAISGFGELASDELPEDHPASVDIAEVLRASDRAASLTRSLLAFSRRTVMQPRLVDLNEVLASLTPMLSRIIGENVHLEVSEEKELGTTLADRSQLEQVILNLVLNARDAMPAGGKVTIATANEDLDADYVRTHVGAEAGPYVVLTVADTGVGMTPDVIEHAFEPFFTTKARGRGSGLGLSTVIGIVQQSGGFVVVDSTPEVGSTFEVHMPRAQGAAGTDEADVTGRNSMGGTETILVAEDEAPVRQFVERVLRGAGYRVFVAANGREALEVAGTLPRFDLLFTDVVMPLMGGVQLAREIVADHPDIRVIFMSGYSEEALPLDGDLGRVPYIPKPFTSDVLLARVRAALDDRPS